MKSLVYVMDPPQYPIKGVDTKLAIHSETVNIEPCSTPFESDDNLISIIIVNTCTIIIFNVQLF